eukprot:m.300560 g.300560  ORF g.300560 m.300560 type:complete len:70 (-) comp16303_c0_seq22:3975-4184(-)
MSWPTSQGRWPFNPQIDDFNPPPPAQQTAFNSKPTAVVRTATTRLAIWTSVRSVIRVVQALFVSPMCLS